MIRFQKHPAPGDRRVLTRRILAGLACGAFAFCAGASERPAADSAALPASQLHFSGVMSLEDGPVFGIGDRIKGERVWLRSGESFRSWQVVGLRDSDNKVVILKRGDARIELELDGAVILPDTPEERAAKVEAERLRELFPVHLILSQTVLAQGGEQPAGTPPAEAKPAGASKP